MFINRVRFLKDLFICLSKKVPNRVECKTRIWGFMQFKKIAFVKKKKKNITNCNYSLKEFYFIGSLG